MVAMLIVGCEIAFWIFVGSGLVCRYLLGFRRLGGLLLAITPVVDLVLLAATAIDLRNGAEATLVHALSAVYLGVSVAYGHRMIRWADAHFAYRFGKGPKPVKPPRYGLEHARHERKMWFLHLAAWAIGCALLLGMIVWIGDESRTADLSAMIMRWSVVLGIDFLWSFSYSIWPRKEKRGSAMNSE